VLGQVAEGDLEEEEGAGGEVGVPEMGVTEEESRKAAARAALVSAAANLAARAAAEVPCTPAASDGGTSSWGNHTSELQHLHVPMQALMAGRGHSIPLAAGTWTDIRLSRAGVLRPALRMQRVCAGKPVHYEHTVRMS